MARVRNMTSDEHMLVSNAVALAEQSTSGEIVTIVAQRSDSYHDAGCIGRLLRALSCYRWLLLFQRFSKMSCSGCWADGSMTCPLPCS